MAGLADHVIRVETEDNDLNTVVLASALVILKYSKSGE
jgi:hypothetical protein